MIGSVFGLAKLSTAVGMIETGWAGGYLMVCRRSILLVSVTKRSFDREHPLQDTSSLRMGAQRQLSRHIGLRYIMLGQWPWLQQA